MELDENTGGEITLAEAQKYVVAFRTKYPNEVKAFFIGSKNVEKILEQADCIGIRIYNGYDSEANGLNLVLVGVDDKGGWLIVKMVVKLVELLMRSDGMFFFGRMIK